MRYDSSSERLAQYTNTVLLDTSFTKSLESYLNSTFHTHAHSQLYSSAIDANARMYGAQIHRLVDGNHTIAGAIRAAIEKSNELPDGNRIGAVAAAFDHLYLRDINSPRGLPLFTLKPDQYKDVSESLYKNFQIPRSWTQDMLHFNAPDALGAAMAFTPLIFGWNKNNAEEFGRLAGSMGFAAIANANPLLGIVAFVSLGKAFNQVINGDNVKDGITGLLDGIAPVAISRMGMATVASLGPPAWVGIAAGIIISYAYQKIFVEGHKRTIETMENMQEIGNAWIRCGEVVYKSASNHSNFLQYMAQIAKTWESLDKQFNDGLEEIRKQMT